MDGYMDEEWTDRWIDEWNHGKWMHGWRIDGCVDPLPNQLRKQSLTIKWNELEKLRPSSRWVGGWNNLLKVMVYIGNSAEPGPQTSAVHIQLPVVINSTLTRGGIHALCLPLAPGWSPQALL